jgi:hypothetical protein
MSKRTHEPDIEKLLEVAPPALVDAIGPEMLDEVLAHVMAQSAAGEAPFLNHRLVNRYFAQAVKATVARRLVVLLDEAARAYDTWEGRTVTPWRVQRMFIDFAAETNLSVTRMMRLLDALPDRGPVWLYAYNEAAGMLVTQIPIPDTPLRRETRVMAWLLFIGAIYSSNIDTDNQRFRGMLLYVALVPFMPSAVLMHMAEAAPLSFRHVANYYGFMSDNTYVPSLYRAHNFLSAVSGGAGIRGSGRLHDWLLRTRYPVVQDWCAHLLTGNTAISAAEREIVTRMAALPRRPHDPPRAPTMAEVLGPVADIARNENNTAADVLRWVNVFHNTGETWTPAEHETVLSTLGTVLAQHYVDAQDEVHAIIKLFPWRDALEVVRRVPAELMDEWDLDLAYLNFFEALAWHPDHVGIDIWNLTFAAAADTVPPGAPQAHVFRTDEPYSAWLELLLGNGYVHVQYMRDMEHVLLARVVPPNGPGIPLAVWRRALHTGTDLADVDVQRTVDVKTRRQAIYNATFYIVTVLAERPLDLGAFVDGLYMIVDRPVPRGLGRPVVVQLLASLSLTRGTLDLDAVRAVAEALPAEKRNVMLSIIAEVATQRAAGRAPSLEAALPLLGKKKRDVY